MPNILLRNECAMSNPEKQITVKLRRAGWEVEIVCSESQLESAMKTILSSLNPSNFPTHIQTSQGSSEAGGNKTSRGLIMDLWQESWFSEGRSLSDVHEEIARRGFHYDKTAVSHSLLDLVKEGILTRSGNMRNYAYIQKRPPSAGTNLTEAFSSTSALNESKLSDA
jgi:hypothetical protein